MITAVRKFDFRLLVNETSNMEKPCSEERLVFLTGSVFSPSVFANVTVFYPRCEGQMHSLG
jgi:hypothetical protein